MSPRRPSGLVVAIVGIVLLGSAEGPTDSNLASAGGMPLSRSDA